MSSFFQRIPFNGARQLRNKQVSHTQFQNGRLDVKVSHLTQEAHQAKIKGLEDTKENIMSNIPDESRRQQERNKMSKGKLAQCGPKMTTDMSSQKSRYRKNSVQTTTTRSRSTTLSRADRNFCISDNVESCYNYQKTMNNIDMHTSTINYQDSHKQTQCSSDNDINNRSDKTIKDEPADEVKHLQSFVLTLDQVLEDKAVSRLRGDITGKARVSELGQVRALNGGRLANAQEVVVNVCHNDHRKLVFHDDEENNNIAKTTSEIRIALWMKYNEGFEAENIKEDTDTVASKTKTAVPHGYNLNTDDERSHKQTFSGRVQANPNSDNKNKGHTATNTMNRSFATSKQNGRKDNVISNRRHRNHVSLVRHKKHNIVANNSVKFVS